MTNAEIKKELISAREKYINEIKAELAGPGSEFSVPDLEHELISASPISRYSVGILFPQGDRVGLDNDEVDQNENDGSGPADTNTADETNKSIKTAESKFHHYEEDDTADEGLDEEISLATQYKPSSVGLTFLVKGKTDIIKCIIKFATYRKAVVTDCMVPYNPKDPNSYTVPPEISHKIIFDKEKNVLRLISQLTGKEVRDIFEKDTIPEDEVGDLKKRAFRLVDCLSRGYVRQPHEIDDYAINFGNKDFVDGMPIEFDGVSVKISALRTRVRDDTWSITIMLVNNMEETPSKPHHCILQPEVKVLSQNNDFIFIENKTDTSPEYMDDEEQGLAMLYRNKKIYGTGLGISADWKVDDDGCGFVKTDYFPICEVPTMDFSLPQNDDISASELSMKYYSDLVLSDKNERINSLRKFVNLYKNWIDRLYLEAKALDPKFSAPASKNIDACKKSYGRMCEGIETLEKDETAWNAFMLANRAMFMQRIHIGMQNKMAEEKADRYPGDSKITDWLNNLDYLVADDTTSRWRPFQLAFLLMDINSIVFDNSKDRLLVDLIWFTTGGGKTEAYLGLTAFTIFYRRLKYTEESDGTAVIMRYTLRLLASQQFTRASTLICACEYIRQDSLKKKHKYPAYFLGNNPITIGLWIGDTHIPNKNDKAEEYLKKLKNVTKPYEVRNAKERNNKFQVLKCPWCGTKLVKDEKDRKLVGEWGYNMKGKHFYMFCPNEDCDFTRRLPIQIIDEELYDNPPTLLFGTVDKFAMMPWDGRIGAFFGVDTERRTPELIIQDELHLISGALGTMVGLYETAIDGLCRLKGVPAKIIASTATIRRANEQCSVLYDRNVAQFPAPGLNAEDSFFAKEAQIDHDRGLFGRIYIGIMPAGKTKAMTEIRTMAALLQREYMADLPDPVKDKLWTLTAYFNSLKDLGKASTLVDDDVKDFIIRTANRLFTSRRQIVSADELTSRVTTTELNETLDRLEKVEYSKENIESKHYASNILLATNMISVGIDVARLNVMLMVGQPKLTSEYIQASSRVGRSYPGVVFVQYDATKSRDRSHYEQFRPYHESFYRFVEPTGATPFSKPARERALHAVIVTLIRQMDSLISDKDAGNFDKKHFNTDIEKVENFVVNRMKDINARSFPLLRDESGFARYEIKEFVDKWQEIVDECHSDEPEIQLYFGRRFIVTPPSNLNLERRLLKQFNSDDYDDAIETMTSMRNVDMQVNGQVVIWED